MDNDPGFFQLLYEFVAEQHSRILLLIWQHIYISLIAVLITLVICIPLGIYLTRNKKLSTYIIGIANIFQTIPSIALLGFLIMFLGIGNKNAICALVMFAMLPVLENTYIGIKNVSPALVQAARGMGMTDMQILFKVELPLAFPVIMGGIRVATVWTIGTASLAASIGGGGLGRLIFSGLTSLRNEVIFAGALPATLLAILADQGLKWFQAYLSPENRAKRLYKSSNKLIKSKKYEKWKLFRMNKKASKILISFLLVSVTSLSFTGCSEKKAVRIAAQYVNETVILAHMANLLIQEDTGLETSINTEFDGSSVLHEAMLNNEIDIYPTWTGTQLTGILHYEGPNLSTEETYNRVKESFEKKFNMTWSKPLGFNNTYILAVTREMADKYKLKKASDLAPYAKDWILAGDENFDTRSDAYPGWLKVYGIHFKEVLPMQYGLMYTALENNEVQVAAAYSTDSRIAKMNLVTLEDDKHFFPDYSGAYVLSNKFVKKYPKALEAINKLGGMIDTSQMAALNLKYDEGEDPEKIAYEFLKEKGLIK